jgi:hypothetical protein
MDLPIYKLSIDDFDLESGIDFISLVENPAIQKNFIAFNDIKTKFAIQNEEKRIITGAAMYADLPIYRRDEEKGEYYVVFDKETIFKIAKKWALTNKYNAVNVDHKQPIEGCTLFESYLLDFERGIMPPKGFEDAKDGSWFVSYLVEDEATWLKCKDGTWNGFSVEGFFNFPINAEQQFLSQLKDILESHLKNATKNK